MCEMPCTSGPSYPYGWVHDVPSSVQTSRPAFTVKRARRDSVKPTYSPGSPSLVRQETMRTSPAGVGTAMSSTPTLPSSTLHSSRSGSPPGGGWSGSSGSSGSGAGGSTSVDGGSTSSDSERSPSEVEDMTQAERPRAQVTRARRMGLLEGALRSERRMTVGRWGMSSVVRAHLHTVAEIFRRPRVESKHRPGLTPQAGESLRRVAELVGVRRRCWRRRRQRPAEVLQPAVDEIIELGAGQPLDRLDQV